MTDAERIRRYGEVVRAVYCSERNMWHARVEKKQAGWGLSRMPRYDGGEDNAGRQHVNMWERVARFAIANRLDPVRLVRAQFVAGMRHRPPEPNHLMSTESVNAYRRMTEESPEEVRRQFEFQKKQMAVEMAKLGPARARMKWTEADAARVILGNVVLPFSALFRHCLATRHGLADVAEAFRDEAAVQYMAQAAEYDVVWGDWITTPLRHEASELARLAGGLLRLPEQVPPPAEEALPQRRIAVD